LVKKTGAAETVIEQSGLVSVNEEKDRVFDRFRGRIMFPVLDINGRPVAFGARAMGTDQPKYLNSPETPAYVKGQHLYGLYQSKESIRKKKFAILVEGYLDLIALYQFGVTNVAASLGTAFTDEQSKLLSRFTRQVVINYDGDAAGAARYGGDRRIFQDPVECAAGAFAHRKSLGRMCSPVLLRRPPEAASCVTLSRAAHRTPPHGAG
jgi:DNA primase catalytic core